MGHETQLQTKSKVFKTRLLEMEISLTLISPSDTSSSSYESRKCKSQFPHDAEEKFSAR